MSKLNKAALVIIATAPIGLAIYAFVFMVRSELAFDEAACPYVERETRDVDDGVRVREDERTCQPGVEEHRWVLLREDREALPIGQRRLEAGLYEGYSWSARMEHGRVRLEIRNPGQDPRVFQGPVPDGGEG